ncbi:MAG: inorganic diphosphatase [Gammaproteobacteria bacterium]|nr:inorganic diphosphatase [Gammaproteobacteria bacterium]
MFEGVSAGDNTPENVNVIIEIPAQSNPVKYEVDKEFGVMKVDRFMATSMVYPCNYGYVPRTLCDDGDPLDVLVVTPYPLEFACVISCRVIGVLRMTDEKGGDSKILAVPSTKLTPIYHTVRDYNDLPELMIHSIAHFFAHYKDLEDGKWVNIDGWFGVEEAKKEVLDSIRLYETTQK